MLYFVFVGGGWRWRLEVGKVRSLLSLMFCFQFVNKKNNLMRVCVFNLLYTSVGLYSNKWDYGITCIWLYAIYVGWNWFFFLILLMINILLYNFLLLCFKFLALKYDFSQQHNKSHIGKTTSFQIANAIYNYIKIQN